MLSQVLVIMIMCVCLQFLRCEVVGVTMETAEVRVSRSRVNVTVTCRTDTPLSGCQFSWWDSRADRAGHVLDLGQGAESPVHPAHLDADLLSYGYSGQGLEAGVCGVRLEVEGQKRWVVACRVKTRGNWAYNWTSLHATLYDPLPYTLERREVVALHGGEAQINLRTEGQLTSCIFFLPGERIFYFNEGPMSANSTGRHRYVGAGLDNGECGVTLTDLTEEDNGLVLGYITPGLSTASLSFISLTVARPPTPPTLELDYNNNILTATCRIQESRPVASITWTLGEVVVRQDTKDDSPGNKHDAWRWPWMTGSSFQTLTRRLRSKDLGSVLKCSVTHVTLTEPLESSEVISFTDCGGGSSKSIVTFISGGETATIEAFPWHVGIYRQVGSTYTQECGGSLIRPNVVLTAAHCFWNTASRSQKDASQYWVAAGKLLREWEDSSPLVQKRQVLRVDTNLFNGRIRNLAYDIALVFLKDPVEMTDAVGLVCLDSRNQGRLTQLHEDSEGVVPGWGLTENGTQSDDLQYVSLPYVPQDTCYRALSENQEMSLSSDKFCAGYRNRSTSVCRGDSGGGLAFLDRDTRRYFVRGIVSVNFKPSSFSGTCYNELYTAFTLVSAYSEWIRRSILENRQ